VAKRVPKDKKSKIPKKYLSGLKGKKISQRANLITTIAELYKAGKRITMRLLKKRSKI